MAQLIAGVEQVLQVLNHRQARANVSVIENLRRELLAAWRSWIVISEEVLAFFVRRHHMETFAQEVGILIGDRLAGGTVDDHRIEQVVLFHQADQAAKRLNGSFASASSALQFSRFRPCTLVSSA